MGAFPKQACQAFVGPLYAVGTWDTNVQGYTAQPGMREPCINVDLHGLRRALTALRREHGDDARRVRFGDGSRDSDWIVLVGRTDGLPREQILNNLACRLGTVRSLEFAEFCKQFGELDEPPARLVDPLCNAAAHGIRTAEFVKK